MTERVRSNYTPIDESQWSSVKQRDDHRDNHSTLGKFSRLMQTGWLVSSIAVETFLLSELSCQSISFAADSMSSPSPSDSEAPYSTNPERRAPSGWGAIDTFRWHHPKKKLAHKSQHDCWSTKHRKKSLTTSHLVRIGVKGTKAAERF